MYEQLATREQEDTVIWLLGTYYDYILSETGAKGRTEWRRAPRIHEAELFCI